MRIGGERINVDKWKWGGRASTVWDQSRNTHARSLCQVLEPTPPPFLSPLLFLQIVSSISSNKTLSGFQMYERPDVSCKKPPNLDAWIYSSIKMDWLEIS